MDFNERLFTLMFLCGVFNQILSIHKSIKKIWSNFTWLVMGKLEYLNSAKPKLSMGVSIKRQVMHRSDLGMGEDPSYRIKRPSSVLVGDWGWALVSRVHFGGHVVGGVLFNIVGFWWPLFNHLQSYNYIDYDPPALFLYVVHYKFKLFCLHSYLLSCSNGCSLKRVGGG